MFWSARTLNERLPELVTDFDKKRIGRSNYTLRIGPEIFLSPTRKPESSTDQTKTRLDPGQDFRIPAGQFAFLLTEERIKVPADAIAFISIRAGYKFRGLVNVSGFHVDPEFEGRLLFAVFNAGPSAIALERGEPCFHIWYASTDHESEFGPRTGYDHIPADVIDKLGEELMSFAGLTAKISDSEQRLVERLGKIESDQSLIKWSAGIALSLFIGLFLAIFGIFVASLFQSDENNLGGIEHSAVSDLDPAPAPTMVDDESSAINEKSDEE
ncbi:MAG: deoxycytidine triphosphate deaminase [Alphaproteobacteria bacterium]|nr:deoxycytidine triphosphate deaminase [Hyphomonas sp.]MBR9806716.1 deoxycytidine triphosphate deaminase [Alphaproteobacteria bacterium]|tara:strand:- start:4117 stop:4926 length:810 start_codon:yes stop_codon:yes gene_type:complete